MTALGTDHLPVFVANKLASYQRGPQETPLLRGTLQSIEWCEPAAPLQGKGWLAQATQPDAEGDHHLEGTCRHVTPQQITKYMPVYYKQAAGQARGEDDTESGDKLQELQQQTLAMHTKWQQQQAAAHAYVNRKMKAGTPFTRPNLTHPKLVGAAGIVPNNMLKHKRKPVKEPDLTKNPSQPQMLHVPSHTGNALLEREGVQIVEQDGKADSNAASRAVRHPRGFQMLGSGFRIRRDHTY